MPHAQLQPVLLAIGATNPGFSFVYLIQYPEIPVYNMARLPPWTYYSYLKQFVARYSESGRIKAAQEEKHESNCV